MAKPLQQVQSRLARLEFRVASDRARERGTGAEPAAGGASIEAVTLTVPPPAVTNAEIVVENPAVTASTRIMAAFAPAADAENDPGEIADTGLSLTPVAEEGQIRFFLSGNARFVGDFDVHYQLSN